MLHSLKALDGFVIAAKDGTLGRVKDIYFDDHHWTVRFLEVDTGLLAGRRVLISPISVLAVDWDAREVSVNLTRQQVHDSPGVDSAVPVARQHEAALFNYYGYPYYWTGPFIWGYTAIPTLDMAAVGRPLPDDIATASDDATEPDTAADPHLRSKDEVIGYSLRAGEEDFGQVDDFLLDERSWSIRLIVADTRSFWPGHDVLVSPARVLTVSWEDKTVVLDLTRAEVENSPKFDPKHLPDDEDYQQLYRGGSSTQANRPPDL